VKISWHRGVCIQQYGGQINQINIHVWSILLHSIWLDMNVQLSLLFG